MRFFNLTCAVLVFIFSGGQVSYSQGSSGFTEIPFNNLTSFRDAGSNWTVAGDAVADYTKPNDIRPVKGEGVLVNTFRENPHMDLITREEFSDVEVELDFMMAKNSNSGIYLLGRYEIQLFDSWTKRNPSFTDAGAIYSRWTDKDGSYEGTAPYMNVAKAPGLWQHLLIRFTAPRFNEKGEKIANARFQHVYLNGVLVQQNAEVTGPTRAALFNDEKPIGPIMIQGDHGPVAFKDLRYRKFNSAQDSVQNKKPWSDPVSPIVVHAKGRPTFIKTFLKHGDKKLTHVISAGHPSQINYSYDLKQGALFQVWRGQFIDVTRSWHDRGEQQLGVPIGSVITLSDAPAVAVLPNDQSAWPDSIAFDEMQNKGYVLNEERSPTFMYSVKGMEVKDSIVFQSSGEGITRTITVINAPSNTYCRLASGKKIESIGDGLYVVDNKSYYIKTDKRVRASVRNSGGGAELIVKYDPQVPVNYSIIW